MKSNFDPGATEGWRIRVQEHVNPQEPYLHIAMMALKIVRGSKLEASPRSYTYKPFV